MSIPLVLATVQPPPWLVLGEFGLVIAIMAGIIGAFDQAYNAEEYKKKGTVSPALIIAFGGALVFIIVGSLAIIAH